MLIAILLFGGTYLAWEKNYSDNSQSETYDAAEIRCGQKPVIASEETKTTDYKVYYEPGPPNENISYGLLSKYDPENLDISAYSNPKFFCSADEAKSAGYEKHECCGVMLPRFEENR